jgi:hypothetical protein
MSNSLQRPSQQKDVGQFAALFAGFAALCLISALVLTSGGETLVSASFESGNGIAGPFKTKKANTVIHVSISQKVPLRGDGENGTYITATLLDERGEYLMSFGHDLWTAAGRDAEGRWAESQTNTAGDFTIPDAGTYSFSLESEYTAIQYAAVGNAGALEAANANGLPRMDVKITQRTGSNIMLLWLGWPAALIAGGLLWMYASFAQKGSS